VLQNKIVILVIRYC